MKIIADANVLFSLCKTDSVASLVAARHKLRLIAPDFSLLELYKYKELIEKKSGGHFNSIVKSLKERVVFVDISEYKEWLSKAKKLISDPKDVAYVALSLKYGLAIWSWDKHFRKAGVEVFTTAELVRYLDRIEA